MSGIATEAELWPPFSGPGDLAAVERTALGQRGLPGSTYELVVRAAELWPDRTAVSVLPDAERFHAPLCGRSPSSRTTCTERRPLCPASVWDAVRLSR